MYKIHYLRPIVSVLKEPPILKMDFCSAGMIPHGTTFKFKFLGEFGIEIKNILEHESEAHMGLIHEKNQRPKISVPLIDCFITALICCYCNVLVLVDRLAEAITQVAHP
jgi:hypothetical protein